MAPLVAIYGVPALSASGALTPEQLDTLVDLVLAPFAVIASITTFVVGFNAFVAWLVTWGPRQQAGIERAIAYGTACAFAPALIPAGYLLYTTISVYT